MRVSGCWSLWRENRSVRGWEGAESGGGRGRGRKTACREGHDAGKDAGEGGEVTSGGGGEGFGGEAAATGAGERTQEREVDGRDDEPEGGEEESGGGGGDFDIKLSAVVGAAALEEGSVAEEHGDGVAGEPELLAEVGAGSGGEVVEDAVGGIPPERVAPGDGPGEFHVFAGSGAVGFWEAAGFPEDVAVAPEVVGDEGFDPAVAVAAAPPEFFVGELLHEDLADGAGIAAAAATGAGLGPGAHGLFDPVGRGDDVGVGEEKDGPAGGACGDVAGAAGAFASAGGNDPGRRGDGGGGAVGGAVVGHEDFDVGPRLGEEAGDATADDGFGVVGGDDGGNQGKVVGGGSGHGWLEGCGWRSPKAGTRRVFTTGRESKESMKKRK